MRSRAASLTPDRKTHASSDGEGQLPADAAPATTHNNAIARRIIYSVARVMGNACVRAEAPSREAPTPTRVDVTSLVGEEARLIREWLRQFKIARDDSSDERS